MPPRTIGTPRDLRGLYASFTGSDSGLTIGRGIAAFVGGLQIDQYMLNGTVKLIHYL
jgi:hypothetical protein